MLDDVAVAHQLRLGGDPLAAFSPSRSSPRSPAWMKRREISEASTEVSLED